MAPALVLAKASAVKSLTKGIRDVGQKILSELFGCRIKPKGTPHEEVFQKAPKYFAQYGSGIPESGKSRFSSASSIFEPITGYVFSQAELEKVMPIEDRKQVEATLRKKCETPTGSFAYYIDVRPAHAFRGYVRLQDGSVYDAATYSLDGSLTQSSPKDFSAVVAKTLPGQTEVDESGKQQNKQASMFSGMSPLVVVGIVLALLFGLFKK